MFLFQGNESYGVKIPFELILCLEAAVHHVANTNILKLPGIFSPQVKTYNFYEYSLLRLKK
jgi:hypothetical protein